MISPPSIGVISWIAIVLLSATYCKYILKVSASDFVKMLFSEFKDLLGLKPTPPALNALGTCILALMALFMYIAPTLSKYIKMASQQGQPSAQEAHWDVVAILGFCAIYTLICLSSCLKHGK